MPHQTAAPAFSPGGRFIQAERLGDAVHQCDLAP
jgi:hypothetical protein